jgi:hypothetical protein
VALGFVKDKWAIDQCSSVDHIRPDWKLANREHRHELIFIDARNLKHPSRRRQCHERCVENVVINRPQHVRRVAGTHNDFEQRHAHTQVTQNWRQEIGACSGTGAEPEPSPVAATMSGHRPESISNRFVYRSDVRKQVATGRCWSSAAT